MQAPAILTRTLRYSLSPPAGSQLAEVDWTLRSHYGLWNMNELLEPTQLCCMGQGYTVNRQCNSAPYEPPVPTDCILFCSCHSRASTRTSSDASATSASIRSTMALCCNHRQPSVTLRWGHKTNVCQHGLAPHRWPSNPLLIGPGLLRKRSKSWKPSKPCKQGCIAGP